MQSFLIADKVWWKKPKSCRNCGCSCLIKLALEACLTRIRKFVASFLALVMALVSGTVPAVHAQNLPLIRDAEIEGLIRRYTRPIFQAAGLNRNAVKVYLVNQPTINAFVAGGQRIFIHTGLLQKAGTPNEVIGVLAHETGHIAGGHLARMGRHIDKASNLAIISMLIGAAAAVGGGLSGSKGASEAGRGIIMGGQSLAQRNILAYVRAQESSADQAAIRYLTKTGQSGRGMLELFYKLSSASIGSLRYTDPYTQSHPMPLTRIRNLELIAKKSPYFDRKDPPALVLRHKLMQAKLEGFLSSPSIVYRKYPRSDKSIFSKYARAIVAFRTGDTRNALPLIDSLIRTIPANPYFWELKGQALLEGGKPALAIAPLKTAFRKSGGNGLIGMLLAQAYLGTGDKKNARAALKVLRLSKRFENPSAQLHALMARAYGVTGDIGHAELETAAAAIRRGDRQLARAKAKNAMKRLKRGSAAWQQAKDIITFAKQK